MAKKSYLPKHKLPSEQRLSRLRRTNIILWVAVILLAAALAYVLIGYYHIPRVW